MWPFSRPVLTLSQKIAVVATEGALLGLYAASAAVTYVTTTTVAAGVVEAGAKGLELSANLANNLANKARAAIKNNKKPEISETPEPMADSPKGPEAGGNEQPAA